MQFNWKNFCHQKRKNMSNKKKSIQSPVPEAKVQDLKNNVDNQTNQHHEKVEYFMEILEIRLSPLGFTLLCNVQKGDLQLQNVELHINSNRNSDDQIFPENCIVHWNMSKAIKHNRITCKLWFDFMRGTIDFDEVMKKWRTIS